MAKRRYYDGPMLASAVDFYAPGSAYGIKELRQHYAVNDAGENVLVRRVGHYYCAARLEGLAFKDEQVDRKTVETYEGRPDGLLSRSVTYAAVDADYRHVVRAAAPRCTCVLAPGNTPARRERTRGRQRKEAVALRACSKRTSRCRSPRWRRSTHGCPPHRPPRASPSAPST